MQDKINVLGMNFDNQTKQNVLTKLIRNIEEQKKTFVVTANPEIVMFAKKNPHYQEIVDTANIVIADGIGVVIGSKILKNPLPERIPGYELVTSLLDTAEEKKLRVYFLGASEEVIESLKVKVHNRYPNLVIAGARNGYFEKGDSSVVGEIVQSNPDIVLVALGCPGQEEWIHKNINAFDKGIFIGVGGSFDVLSGKVKRAPVIWQKLNLEWLYRLIKQPSRLKRTLVLPQFLIEVWKTKKIV